MQIYDEPGGVSANVQLTSVIVEKAQRVCAAEGMTLDEFVSLAVAEKAERYAEAEWLRRRKSPDPASILAARRLLRRPDSRPPDPGDELPEGYVLPALPPE